MQRIALVIVVQTFAAALTAISASSVSAQSPKPPAIDINCNDFTKEGPDAWFANGSVHFKIGDLDVTYNNSTIKPGTKAANGVDVYALLDNECGGH